MKSRVLLSVAAAAGAVVAIGQFSVADTDTAAGKRAPQLAATTTFSDGVIEASEAGGVPDVYVFKISGTANWSQGNMRAYSVGTTSCNEGTAVLQWQANNNQHPVIGQNMFRLAPGQNGHLRFEHLGQAWLKHGFCALSQNECGDCQPTPCSNLGIGCSDPYTANRNGTQSTAGPKWQVNATTGFFPYPPSNPSFSGPLARRLQVPLSEVVPADNPGAEYFFEAQYVCPDENVEVNIVNAADNVSYRQATLNGSGALVGYQGDTVIKLPAMYAWKDADPDVLIKWRAIEGIGNFFIGSQAYDNGDGTWDYEYAVQNMDSDRSIGGVSIDVDPEVTVTGIGFSDVGYHSGEPWDGTDWDSARNSATVAWNTVDPASLNPQGNAIRWGTVYNFRFTADAPPVVGTMVLDYFDDGEGGNSFSTDAKVPATPGFCAGDFDGDGTVGFSDITALLADWGTCTGDCPADLNNDSRIDFIDLVNLLGIYGDCP